MAFKLQFFLFELLSGVLNFFLKKKTNYFRKTKKRKFLKKQKNSESNLRKKNNFAFGNKINS